MKTILLILLSSCAVNAYELPLDEPDSCEALDANTFTLEPKLVCVVPWADGRALVEVPGAFLLHRDDGTTVAGPVQADEHSGTLRGVVVRDAGVCSFVRCVGLPL